MCLSSARGSLFTMRNRPSDATSKVLEPAAPTNAPENSGRGSLTPRAVSTVAAISVWFCQ